MTPSEIGALIRLRRKQMRLTQEDLAQLVGVNRRLVSEVERGSERVSLHHLNAICNAVGLDLSVRARYPDGRQIS